MYQVYCKPKNKKMVEYSRKFETKEEAENCKLKAESLMTCNVKGELIKYKIMEA